MINICIKADENYINSRDNLNTNQAILHITNETLSNPIKEEVIPMKKLLMRQKTEAVLKKDPSIIVKKRSSFLNYIGILRKDSHKDNDENNSTNKANNSNNTTNMSNNTNERLNFIKKLTMFFNKKEKIPDEMPKALIQSRKSITETPGLTLQGSIETGTVFDSPRVENPPIITPNVQPENEKLESKVIYEEVNENEKDEFEKEIFNDQMVFENKLLRYQYYEHLKAILNNQDDEEQYELTLESESDNERELNKQFKKDGLAEYEREYQKISNAIKEVQGSIRAEKKNNFELIKMYSDPYPFLKIRKNILYCLRYF